MAGGTGVVDIGSELKRKAWMREGLIGSAAKSFWMPYQGRNFKSIVFQTNDISKREGHHVTFDFSGKLVGKGFKGKETATGKGETKRKFSDNIMVDRWRFPVDNGDKFDGVNIGDLSINEHKDSREKLSDLWVRVKDQAIFDVMQQSATHRITSKTFTFDDFLDVENTIKTGSGYKVMTAKTAAPKRMPLEPFMLHDGRPIWLMVVDSGIKTKLMKSTGAQQVFRESDVRGNENRLIRGVIGKVGNFLVVEADTFFGETDKNLALGGFVDGSGYAQLNKSEVILSGMRQYTCADDAFVPVAWSGDQKAAGAKTVSRGLILGGAAMQVAMGLEPDYKFQESRDFGISSESLLEVWGNFKATKYVAENEDYSTAIGGISNGIVALDIQID